MHIQTIDEVKKNVNSLVNLIENFISYILDFSCAQGDLHFQKVIYPNHFRRGERGALPVKAMSVELAGLTINGN